MSAIALNITIASKVGFAPVLKGSQARGKASQAAKAKAQHKLEAVRSAFDAGTYKGIVADAKTFERLCKSVPHKLKHNGFASLNDREKAIARHLYLV